jgi:glycosyltransferase involved in cell wall biosynthesis
MTKIAIVLPNLRGGGAERLAIYLAHYWCSRGYAPEFVLMQEEGELLPLLAPGIRVVSLNAHRIKWSILPLWRYLKRTRPEVVWVGMWPLTSAAIMAWLLAGRPGKIVVTDHNQLSISCLRELEISPWFLKGLMRLTYPFASGVTAVSQGVGEDLCRLGGFRPGRVKVIYNPAATGVSPQRETAAVREQMWGAGFSHHILTVGTLKVQKNHELLICAFARLPPDLKAKLTILGDGDRRPRLEGLIRELGLEGRVALPGFAVDPYPWFRSADLFVLSSDWEGLGNVLIEALECGLPVVSTDCPSGPAEILEGGRYGRLVPVDDAPALAEAMLAGLTEPHDREAAIRRAKDFTVEKIGEEYLAYFRTCGARL